MPTQGATPWLVLAQLATTLPLAGLIWTIQLVHYPLFAKVGAASFASYHSAHTAQITPLVLPLMTIELLAALGTVRWPMQGAPSWFGPSMLGLVLCAWGVTAFASVPAHEALSAGFDGRAHDRLVLTNWLRTVAWTARAALLLWALRRAA